MRNLEFVYTFRFLDILRPWNWKENENVLKSFYLYLFMHIIQNEF